MRFDLDGLDVFFPYDRLYLEQHQYMRSLKQSLDAGGHALLEMPTGTGKTVCLLSLITSYQYAHPNTTGKLVYCTRTVPEMNHVMEELATVLDYRRRILQEQEETERQPPPSESINTNNDIENLGPTSMDSTTTSSSGAIPIIPSAELSSSSSSSFNHNSQQPQRKKPRKVIAKQRNTMGPASSSATYNGAGGAGVLALCLSSRRNLCVNEAVVNGSNGSDAQGVDAACRNRTATWVRERAQQPGGSIETCEYFENFMDAGESCSMPSGVYDLNALQDWGTKQGWCPYYLTRRALNHAHVLVFNYQYMLDPKVAKLVSQELESESVIVFDEAHNIDSVCIEALSVTLRDRGLEQATRSLGRLSSEVARLKASDQSRLQNEYQNLVHGLVDQGLLQAAASDASLASNVLNPDVLQEAVPGNIRRAEHFIGFMKKVLEHLKGRLRAVAGPNGGVRSETPLAFLHRLTNGTSLESKPLRFAYSRLASLLRTLQVSNLDEFGSLTDVADFCSLLAAYSEGVAKFAIIMEPNGSNIPGATDPVIQLACLDSSLAIAPLFKRFGSVIVTSGTLSPIDLYPKLLQFQPCVSESLSMSTFRPCIRPLVITRGSDQLGVSTKYEDRGDMGVIRNYGAMLVELCSNIPDGAFVDFSHL